ncbi:hypothetical protein PVAP13_2NG278712 [Panicum virgatum]|uniref:Uncharacterized protein n=1 Tax=Panicum virgatum TaxID=38727 RepID=A0A8T0VIA7_PANVG|nr:hypothetical protein PVAP13_2NG278712 [Panicum virgatum]
MEEGSGDSAPGSATYRSHEGRESMGMWGHPNQTPISTFWKDSFMGTYLLNCYGHKGACAPHPSPDVWIYMPAIQPILSTSFFFLVPFFPCKLFEYYAFHPSSIISFCLRFFVELEID